MSASANERERRMRLPVLVCKLVRTGQQLCEAAGDGDAAKVSTLLSTQGAQSFINYQEAHGYTPLHIAAVNGHAAVTEQLIAARCNVNLQAENGWTPIHYAAGQGYENFRLRRRASGGQCTVPPSISPSTTGGQLTLEVCEPRDYGASADQQDVM